jgi:hypothetical protein
MTNIKLIAGVILSAIAASPAFAATGRDSITKEQVAAAMSGAGLHVSPEQVMLLTDVTASTNAPALRVESMERWGDDRMRVRLDCAKQEDCLPFYVAVRWPQADSAQTAQVGSTRPLAAIVSASPEPKSYAVRAGSPAILLLDGDHVHIRISVVCLENGVAGQTIRVASKDHQKTFTAEVVDGTVLRGSL